MIEINTKNLTCLTNLFLFDKNEMERTVKQFGQHNRDARTKGNRYTIKACYFCGNTPKTVPCNCHDGDNADRVRSVKAGRV